MSYAERIRDAAARSGAPVFVGHIYLHHPAFLAALELLPELGPVRSLICESANDRPRTDSSVLWDWLPHDLSMARALFGREAGEVRAWKLLENTRIEVAACEYRFDKTMLLSMVSWRSPVRIRRITITCRSAVVFIDDRVEHKLTVFRGGNAISYPNYSNEPPLSRELAVFLQMVRSEVPDASHIEIGLGIVREISAAERSADMNGKSISLSRDVV